MTLGSDIAAALPGLRAEAESRMTETVTAGTFTDGVAEDGSPTREVSETIYTGIGRVRYATADVSTRDAAGSPVATQTPILSIPYGSPRLFDGTEVVVDASTADGALVGRSYRVSGNGAAGQTTAHRYPLEELT